MSSTSSSTGSTSTLSTAEASRYSKAGTTRRRPGSRVPWAPRWAVSFVTGCRRGTVFAGAAECRLSWGWFSRADSLALLRRRRIRSSRWSFCHCVSGASSSPKGAYWAATIGVGGRHCATACGVLNTGGNVVGGIVALTVPITVEWLGWGPALGTASLFAFVAPGLWLFIRADRAIERTELRSGTLTPGALDASPLRPRHVPSLGDINKSEGHRLASRVERRKQTTCATILPVGGDSAAWECSAMTRQGWSAVFVVQVILLFLGPAWLAGQSSQQEYGIAIDETWIAMPRSIGGRSLHADGWREWRAVPRAPRVPAVS